MNDDDRTSAQPTASPTSVLVVCAANVCRSPAIEYMLAWALEREGLSPPWTLASAGASAMPGRTMCGRSAASLKHLPGGEDFVARHRSRLLTPELVESAGLILTASTKERAAVARLIPAARQRTYTLREAVLLIERAASRPGPFPGVPTGQDLVLSTLVEVLNRQRGTLAQSLTPGPTQGRWRRRRGRLVDIGDVHSGEERRHKPVLGTIRGDTARLARAASRLLSTPTFDRTTV